MAFKDIMREALRNSPVKGAPLRTPITRPPAKGVTGKRPYWNRKSFPVPETLNEVKPVKDDPNWVEVKPGRYRFTPSGGK